MRENKITIHNHMYMHPRKKSYTPNRTTGGQPNGRFESQMNE